MAIEIERKFLVTGSDWRAAAHARALLRQGYLAQTARASVRVRVAGTHGWLSVKAARAGRTREEYEVAVPVADAEAMLDQLCDGPLIEKWRHRVEVAGTAWEIDEFLGENAGLIVAEVELSSEQAEFVRPAWLGREVTEDARYYNSSLARRPFRHWPENLVA